MNFLALSQLFAHINFRSFQLLQPSLQSLEPNFQLMGFYDELLALNLSELLLHLLVAAGCSGLTLERPESAFDLADNVVDTKQVLLGQFQFQFGTTPSALVSCDPGSLLDDGTPLHRFGAQEPTDFSLGNEGIRSEPKTCFFQHRMDIFETATTLVDRIDTFSGAVELAADFQHFSGKLRFL